MLSLNTLILIENDPLAGISRVKIEGFANVTGQKLLFKGQMELLIVLNLMLILHLITYHNNVGKPCLDCSCRLTLLIFIGLCISQFVI